MRTLRYLILAIVALGAACADDDPAPPSTDGQAQNEPACDELLRFADVLVDTGITYDYEPSTSPADLASTSDAVFGGRLTGRTESKSSYIGYEVEITRVVDGPAEWVAGDLVTVYIEYAASYDADRYTEAVATGAPVAVFASDHPPLGELVASIEGFMTSCPDGPLLGWTGTQGDWPSLLTVDQVLDAAEGSVDPGPNGGETGSASFTLHVSNQSFEDPSVDIVVTIDGDEVVAQTFDVEGQHNWKTFELDLGDGSHSLRAMSSTGAVHHATFELRDGEPLWAVLDYWWYPGDGPRHFSFSTHDEPVGFG